MARLARSGFCRSGSGWWMRCQGRGLGAGIGGCSDSCQGAEAAGDGSDAESTAAAIGRVSTATLDQLKVRLCQRRPAAVQDAAAATASDSEPRQLQAGEGRRSIRSKRARQLRHQWHR
uniref:Uncharacterized protein n=1 Tax=Macrostomum lignano TaxID=282301 RepID=A0A1I8F6H1_9PLAT